MRLIGLGPTKYRLPGTVTKIRNDNSDDGPGTVPITTGIIGQQFRPVIASQGGNRFLF